MLVCEQCGCSGKLGMGWLHVVRADVEETEDASLLVEYCPACAEVVFGHRRDVVLLAKQTASDNDLGRRGFEVNELASDGSGVLKPAVPQSKPGLFGLSDAPNE